MNKSTFNGLFENNFKFLINKRYLIFIIGFIGVRIYLLNYNQGELVDTYDILYRAKEILNFQYSKYECRLPVYPFLIALSMLIMDGLLGAKIINLFVSIGIIYLCYKLYDTFFPKERGKFLFLVLLFFNPYYLFWSIRPLTEPTFVFFVLLSFYFFYCRNTKYNSIFCGLSIGLSAMTRNEGNCLLLAILITLILMRDWRKILTISIVFLTVVMPWFIRNKILYGQFFYSPYIGTIPMPLLSGIFNSFHLPPIREWIPIDYVYSLPWIFLDLFFLIGFPLSFIWIANGIKYVISNFGILKVLATVLFIFLEIIISSIAVISSDSSQGRHLLPIIPFLLIFFIIGITKPFELNKNFTVIFSIIILSLFIIGVKKYTPMFPAHLLFYNFFSFQYAGLLLILFTAFLSIKICFWSSIPQKFHSILVSFLVIITSLPALTVLKGRQVHYPSLLNAIPYAITLDGKIAYACASSLAMPRGITGWYLGEKGIPYPHGDKYEGMVLTDNQQIKWLKTNKISYVMWHNEREEGKRFTVLENPQYVKRFILIKEFKSSVKPITTTKIYRFKENRYLF